MTRNRPLIVTAFNSAASLARGMVFAQRGPSFNDLMLISGADVQGGSYYVTSGNVGFLLGSLLAGLLYHRVQRKALPIAVAMSLTGAFTILTPWCRTFVPMLLAYCLVSLGSCLYETIITTEEIQAWDGSSEAAIQVLSFCYSVGAVFGPLITEPFMAPKQAHSTLSNSSEDVYHAMSSCSENNYPSAGLLKNCTHNNEQTEFRSNLSIDVNLRNESLNSEYAESNIHYAFLITGAFCIAVSLVFYVSGIKSFSTKQIKRKRGEQLQISHGRKLPRNVYFALIALSCAHFYFFVIAVDPFGQYMFYFVVTHLDWSKENGSFLASLYWGLGTCLKLVLIVIYRWVDAGLILGLCIVGTIVSMSAFIIASQYHIHVLVWISTSLMGLSQASIFPSAFSWIDGNLLKLDGKETGAMMISASLGAITAPLPLGVLMKDWSLMTFPYFVLFQLIACAVVFFAMICIAKPIIDRRYGPLRRTVDKDVPMPEELGELNVQNDSTDETTNKAANGV